MYYLGYVEDGGEEDDRDHIQRGPHGDAPGRGELPVVEGVAYRDIPAHSRVLLTRW